MVKDTPRPYPVKFSIEYNQFPGSIEDSFFVKLFNDKHFYKTKEKQN